MDLRKPGEEEDEYSELAEEAMDPDNCFPDGKNRIGSGSGLWSGSGLTVETGLIKSLTQSHHFRNVKHENLLF